MATMGLRGSSEGSVRQGSVMCQEEEGSGMRRNGKIGSVSYRCYDKAKEGKRASSIQIVGVSSISKLHASG